MNHSKARLLLFNSFKQSVVFTPQKLSQQDQTDINNVINGHHLTFRYILVTALLAKAADKSIHMRSLQAQAKLSGAYDARSLCHKVFVPFEQIQMKCKLGGSNEPYLNKPARFPAVDPGNAVRKGKDQNLLNLMYNLLERLNFADSDIHNEALLYAIKLIAARPVGLVHKIELPEVNFSQFQTWGILDKFLENCSGGETAVATVGALFKVMELNKSQKVIVHPVNQAGSSSNEVGDIDIKAKKLFLCAIEVKDKMFSENDINHAVRKVIEHGNNRLIFVMGRHALPVSKKIKFTNIVNRNAKRGFDISFLKIDLFSKIIIAMLSEEQRKKIITCLAEALDEMRATDATKDHFKSILS